MSRLGKVNSYISIPRHMPYFNPDGTITKSSSISYAAFGIYPNTCATPISILTALFS